MYHQDKPDSSQALTRLQTRGNEDTRMRGAAAGGEEGGADPLPLLYALGGRSLPRRTLQKGCPRAFCPSIFYLQVRKEARLQLNLLFSKRGLMSQIPRILQAFVWAVLHSQFSDSASLPPGSGTPARSYIHSQPSAPAATSTTSPTSSSSSSSSSSTNIELGAILGSVLGAFVFALCICSCCYFLRSSTKKKVEHDNSGNSSTTSASIASSDLSGLEGETHLRYMSESDVSYSFSGASSPEQQQNVRRSRPYVVVESNLPRRPGRVFCADQRRTMFHYGDRHGRGHRPRPRHGGRDYSYQQEGQREWWMGRWRR